MNVLNRLRTAEQHMQAGRLHQAHAVCGKVLEDAPHDLSAHIVLGAVLLLKKDYAASERALKQVIAAIPGHVDANNNLGVISLEHHKDFAAAQRYFTAALAVDPGNLNALGNLGNTWLKLGNMDSAETCYRNCLDLAPENLMALNNLGALLFKRRRHEEAARYLWRAVELWPEDIEAYFNLANTLLICNDIPQAVKLMRRIIALAEPGVALLAAFAIAKMTCCWEITEAIIAPVTRLILSKAAAAEGFGIINLSLLADHRIDNDTLFAVHLAMGESIDAMRATAPFETYPNVVQPKAKLRLGYLSADFRQHVASNYIRSLVNHYDGSRFEVYCYSNTQREDDLTEKYRTGVDAFINVCHLTDAELAQKIHDDRIDILVDLGGYTQDTRIHVLSYRPAPVQMSYLTGYPYSSGLRSVDYLISDPYLDGPLNARYCTETPLRLPESFGTFDALYEQHVDPVPAYAKNGHVTFGSLINPYKLNPDVIRVWSAILRCISNAVLVLNYPLYKWDMIRANITQEFARHGITENQLKFVWQKHPEGGHLRYYNDIDIALDSFPMTGGQTSADAIWMGVPLITLAGDTHHQRLSYSLLRNAGIALDDLISFSREEYLEKALALAHQPERIKALREAIPQALKHSIFCDPVRFARQIENLYIEGWNRKFPQQPFLAHAATAAAPEFVPLRCGAEVALSGRPGDLADFVIREQAGWFDPEYDFVHRLTRPGMRVVECNPGRGIYALPLALKIAPTGELWAIPDSGEETELLRKAVHHNHIGNLHLAVGAGALARAAHAMGGVDFIRLNLPAEDGLHLIKNEPLFFSEHSPLVMFSARRADTLDLALADGFSGLGYGVYRYLPGLDLLAPLTTPEDLDAFTLNLFACKPDHTQLLVQQGLMINALPPLAGLPTVHEKIWQTYLGALPYAAGFMVLWTEAPALTEGWENYHVALNLFARAQSSATAAGERYACLHTAHGILAMLVSAQPTLPRLLSLARVLIDIGKREQAVQVLNNLLALFAAGVEMAPALEPALKMDEPFLALSDQAAATNPGARMAEWIFASVLEQRETLRAFSAFFLGPDHIAALQAIERTGFMGAAMARRLRLVAAQPSGH